jgi:hypothetical protein
MLNESAAVFIGLGLTAIGLFYAGYQIYISRKVARGEFLLHLDEILQQHDDTHIRLRPGGNWANSKSGPKSNKEWVAVERYMGLFERVNILVEDKIIDIDTIYRLYGYRVINISENEKIRQFKLEKESRSWEDFIRLRDKIIQIHKYHSTWWYKTLRFFHLVWITFRL